MREMRDTEWFAAKKWGIDVGLLRFFDRMSYPTDMQPLSVEEVVTGFDIDRFVKDTVELGAGYVIFPLNQQSRFYMSPNETYNKMMGYKPGEAAPVTDIIPKLSDALAEHGIELIIYFALDGPTTDFIGRDLIKTVVCGDPYPNYYDILGKPFEGVSMHTAKMNADIVREYSLRWKDKVKAWWLDGAYYNIGYTDDKLEVIANACREGNPQALVSCNIVGLADEYAAMIDRVQPGASCDDFTFGEQWNFSDIPEAAFLGHCRWHVWSWFDSTLQMMDENFQKIEYTPEYISDYVKKVNERGGVVSFSVKTEMDGRIDERDKNLLGLLK